MVPDLDGGFLARPSIEVLQIVSMEVCSYTEKGIGATLHRTPRQ
jgi:hypothetical protein